MLTETSILLNKGDNNNMTSNSGSGGGNHANNAEGYSKRVKQESISEDGVSQDGSRSETSASTGGGGSSGPPATSGVTSGSGTKKPHDPTVKLSLRKEKKSAREKARRQRENALFDELAQMCNVPSDTRDKSSVLKAVIQRVEELRSRNAGGGNNNNNVAAAISAITKALSHASSSSSFSSNGTDPNQAASSSSIPADIFRQGGVPVPSGIPQPAPMDDYFLRWTAPPAYATAPPSYHTAPSFQPAPYQMQNPAPYGFPPHAMNNPLSGAAAPAPYLPHGSHLTGMYPPPLQKMPSSNDIYSGQQAAAAGVAINRAFVTTGANTHAPNQPPIIGHIPSGAMAPPSDYLQQQRGQTDHR